MSDPAETDKQRIERLYSNPNSATKFDVKWLAMNLATMYDAVDGLKKQAGRFFGLREAAEMLEVGSRKSQHIRILVGKKEQAMRAMNERLLLNMATLIRQYAKDAENLTGPFATKLTVDSPAAPNQTL